MKKTGENTNKTNKTKPMITSKHEPNKKIDHHTCPLANKIAISTATSITHDMGST
jgi:hypothetical protein